MNVEPLKEPRSAIGRRSTCLGVEPTGRSARDGDLDRGLELLASRTPHRLVCRWRPGRQATLVWSREPRDSAPPPLGGFALSSEGTLGINHKCCAVASRRVASTRARPAKSAIRRPFERFAGPRKPSVTLTSASCLGAFRSGPRQRLALSLRRVAWPVTGWVPARRATKFARRRSAVDRVGYAVAVHHATPPA
jgi:hypothetical protein